MRARKTILLLLGLAALPACQKKDAEQNIVITNEIPPNADVEALPPDESVATPTDELANGSDNADVGDANASTNGY